MEGNINNIYDIMDLFGCKDVDALRKWFESYDYPITFEYCYPALMLKTDADGVPYSKMLSFPFTEDKLDDALTGLLCQTDYAMCEGYWETHTELFKQLALRYAEKHGIYEYTVNEKVMEYWSLYEDGFDFYRVHLDTDGSEGRREHECHIDWHKNDGTPIPAFLVTETGATKYNYFCG